MKKILSLLLLLTFAAGSATAQNAEAIIQRYYKQSGMDKVDLKNATADVAMEMTMNGMNITAMILMQMPDKMVVEMDMMGQKISMRINGSQGVMSVPGMGQQELPQEQIQQFKKQNDMLSAMKWNLEEFNLTLKPSVTKDGKECDVVEMSYKKTGPTSFKYQTMYFDHKTGLLNSSEITMAGPEGDIMVTTKCSEYMRSGEILYPSQIEASTTGLDTKIRITKMNVNCPMDDKLFEIGE